MAEEFTATQAADALAAFTRVFRAAEHLHKAASWASNMEQVQRELTEQVEYSRTALKALQDELDDARAAVASERAKGKKATEAAQAKAEGIVADAEAKAAEVTAAAEEHRNETARAVAQAEVELGSHRDAIEVARNDLEALEQKLTDARAAIASLLGTATA